MKPLLPIGVPKPTPKRKPVVLEASLDSVTNDYVETRIVLHEIDRNGNSEQVPRRSQVERPKTVTSTGTVVVLDIENTTGADAFLDVNMSEPSIGKSDSTPASSGSIMIEQSLVNIFSAKASSKEPILSSELMILPELAAVENAGKVEQKNSMFATSNSILVEEVVKRPHSPLNEQSENVVSIVASGKKSRANICFPPSVLGLIQGPNGNLISKPAPLIKPKKKRGCPIGSKNKTPSQRSSVAGKDVLSILLADTPPSPDPKGKAKM